MAVDRTRQDTVFHWELGESTPGTGSATSGACDRCRSRSTNAVDGIRAGAQGLCRLMLLPCARRTVDVAVANKERPPVDAVRARTRARCGFSVDLGELGLSELLARQKIRIRVW